MYWKLWVEIYLIDDSVLGVRFLWAYFSASFHKGSCIIIILLMNAVDKHIYKCISVPNLFLNACGKSLDFPSLVCAKMNLRSSPMDHILLLFYIPFPSNMIPHECLTDLWITSQKKAQNQISTEEAIKYSNLPLSIVSFQWDLSLLKEHIPTS